MKYCTKCGAELADEAVVCPKCGCAVEGSFLAPAPAPAAEESPLQVVAKVFMLIALIVSGFALIPLCWTIPMTVHYFRATKEHIPVGIGFKVCTLLFVNLVSGICMLCENN